MNKSRSRGIRSTWARYLRSLLFNIGFYGSTTIWSVFVLLACPLKFERRFQIARGWARFNIWWLERTCRIRCEIRGLEHIQTSRPGIILAKHQSAWETIFLQILSFPQIWVMKRELLRIPVFGWALRTLQSIEVDRNAPSAAAKLLLKQGTHHLREGRWIVIFPEGTRVAPGSRGRYNVGGAWLAAHSGYPIFPIAHNAGYRWPRRGFIKYPGTIQLVIGPPIESVGQKPQTLIRLTEDWIEETMIQLDQANESP